MRKPKVTVVIAGPQYETWEIENLQWLLNEQVYGNADGAKNCDRIVVLVHGSVVVQL